MNKHCLAVARTRFLPAEFVLEVGIVQPQLQVVGLLPDANVELLCTPHCVLLLTLPRLLGLPIRIPTTLLWLQPRQVSVYVVLT